MQRALIVGVDGQDGAYLARHLVRGGDEVVGTWLDEASFRRNFAALGVGTDDLRANERFVLPDGPDPWRALLERHRPDEVYLLAGISSVGLSFEKPVETLASTAGAVALLLEALRRLFPQTRLFYAGSAECFGATPPGGRAADEETPFRPGSSPYAVGKAAAMELARMYRAAYGMHVCVGILSNHESPLRPPAFVTRKVVDGALAIKAGRLERLELGNLDIRRDWGLAEEYVEAFPLMLRTGTAEDFVIATGRTRGLREFVELVFAGAGLGDWRRWVVESPPHFRPVDIPEIRVDPGKAERVLGWRARSELEGVVKSLLAGMR